MSAKKLKDATLLCHDDDYYGKNEGAIVPPIYQNSLFAFENWDSLDKAFDDPTSHHIYTRLSNPTVAMAEEKLARLCHGEKAKLMGSGIAAIAASILHFVNAGDHIITINTLYGPADNFIKNYLHKKCGVTVTYVSGKNIDEFEQAIKANTKVIYLESPSSISYDIQDLRAVGKLARTKGIKTIIDNTWSSPIFQKPLEMGIDIEVHSATKYICGHSDVVAGLIVGTEEDINGIQMSELNLLGAKMAPFEAWLILRSLRTLPIRMKAHEESAKALLSFLEKEDKIADILYPGHPSHSQYELAKSQMSGFGALLTINLKTNDLDRVKAFVDALNLFKLGVSWGGHESLVYAPALSYLKELSEEQLANRGIQKSWIRLSIGLEDVQDLISDIKDALQFI